METPSGSPPPGESGSPPERTAPPFTPRAAHAEPHHDAPSMGGEEPPETSAAESLDVTPAHTAPETGLAADDRDTDAPAVTYTASGPTESPRGTSAAPTEMRPPMPPPPPPPLRYGEPRPAITPNRVGEPIRVAEPPVAARPTDPNASTQLSSPGATQVQGATQSPGQNQGSAYPSFGAASAPTPYAPQPQSSGGTPYAPQSQSQPPQQYQAPQPPQPVQQPAPQPQAPQPQVPQGQAQTQPGTAANSYSYPPQQPSSYSPPAPTTATTPLAQPPRPYGASGATTYPPLPTAPPPPGSVSTAVPAGYTPANTLVPATTAARPTSGANTMLLTLIAILLAIIAIVQVLNLVRPTRLDTTAPVQVQAKPLSQQTRSQVQGTLDNAQKAITDINTQAQTDYNAATTDAQRQAILAKYSFTLQQIIAQEQYDVLRIMQEQSTP